MQKIPLTNRSAQSDPAVHIAFRRIALQKAVKRKYPRPAYAVLFDLPNPIHSLPRANRQIQKTKPLDCLVLSLYESRDFEIIGIHFALSIDELKQIKETDQSNHAILSCTDKIYIATDLSLEIFDEAPVYQAGESHQSKAISQPGIMQLQHCGLRILKPSNTFKANTMSRAISSLLIRKAMEHGREDALNDSLMKSQKEIYKFKCDAELSLVHAQQEVKALKQKVTDLEFSVEQANFDLKKAKSAEYALAHEARFDEMTGHAEVLKPKISRPRRRFSLSTQSEKFN